MTKPAASDALGQAEHLEWRLHDQPRNAELWGRLGCCYARMGHDGLALEVLEQAASLGCADPSAWYRLSFLRDDAGRAADAVEAARRAVELDPGSVRVLVNLGTRLVGAGRPHEAIPFLQKAVLLWPEAAEPIGVLGIAQYRAQAFAAAAECLETALRRDPDADASAWAYLGVSLDETGRPAGAVHALETACFLKPNYGWAWGRLGKALRALGRHAEAIAAYEKAIGSAFAPSVVWWDMGLSAAAVADLGQLERACKGLRPLDRGLATKLRRKLRSLRTAEAAAAPPEAEPGAGPCESAAVGT